MAPRLVQPFLGLTAASNEWTQTDTQTTVHLKLWAAFTGETDKSKTVYFKFLQDFVHQKLFKSVPF